MSHGITWVAKGLQAEAVAWERQGAAGASTLSFPGVAYEVTPVLPLQRKRPWNMGEPTPDPRLPGKVPT